MPITQDRLIRLIDITDRTLQWAHAIQTFGNSTTTLIMTLANSLEQDASPERLAAAIKMIKTNSAQLNNLLHDNPLPMEDVMYLGQERGHFKAREKRNTAVRDYLRYSRAGKKEENAAGHYTKPTTLTLEQLAEIEEFDAMPSRKEREAAAKLTTDQPWMHAELPPDAVLEPEPSLEAEPSKPEPSIGNIEPAQGDSLEGVPGPGENVL